MQKLIFQNQSEMFERVVRDARGTLFRVRFVVVEREGTLRGRVISCIPLYVLEGTRTTPKLSIAKKIGGIMTSPYFNKFAFLTAIKIRAPSFTH